MSRRKPKPAPPLIAELYRDLEAEFVKTQRRAASGMAGCIEARRRLIRIRADMLSLEIRGTIP